MVWELDSWELAMRAERLAPGTVKGYLRVMRSFPGPLSRTGVRVWLAAELERGAAPKTLSTSLCAVKAYSRWAAEEGLLAPEVAAVVRGVRAPKIDVPVIQPLSEDELKRLLGTCGGDFGGLRDRALLMLMVETGMRSSEVVGLQMDDVDVKRGIAVVRRGKGGRGRVVPFSPQAGRALDRYLRARRTHSKARAGSDAVWLGVRGAGFGYSALWLTLKARAERVGLDDFHPHKLRHTAAHRWLAAGGSEGGLRSVAGWTAGSAMLARYAAGAAAERAVAEAAGLGLGLS